MLQETSHVKFVTPHTPGWVQDLDTLIWQHWTARWVGHFKKVSSIVQGKDTGSEIWVFSRSGLFKVLLTLWFWAFHLTLITASVNCGKYDPSGGLIMGIN